MSALSSLAAAELMRLTTKYAITRKREVARKAKRRKFDEDFNKGRTTAPKKAAPLTQSQKAAQRRESITKNVVPLSNLLKALTQKKK